MAEVTNSDRAGWASQALDRFAEVCRGDDDFQTQCKDLLTDLAHLCRFNGEDFTSLAMAAQDVADIEKIEDEDGESPPPWEVK